MEMYRKRYYRYLEGLQTMRNLAKNMAWMIKCIDAGKKAGINTPEQEAESKNKLHQKINNESRGM